MSINIIKIIKIADQFSDIILGKIFCT